MNGLAPHSGPITTSTRTASTRTASSAATNGPGRHPSAGPVARADRRRIEPPTGRDLVVDLARVAAVVFVVVVHVAFAGVRLATDGSVAVEKTVTLLPWFTAATWITQVMPLFFVVGGFAAASSLRSVWARGERDRSFIRARLLRLARPSLPVFAAFAIGLFVASRLPIDQELVAGVAVVVGSPLWFLAAFAIVQTLAPVLLRAHERRPLATLGGLVAAAIVVDALRASTDVVALGLPNLVFVWAAVQQLGFWMRDGWFARRSRRSLVALIAASYAAVAVYVAIGIASADMLDNQFPPTVPLVFLGVAQAAGLQLARPVLEHVVRARAVQAVMFVVGTRAMTIYCWHSPVILLLLGVQLLVPATLSEPGSARWWLERIPFTLLVFAVLWLLGRALARFEDAPARTSPDQGIPNLAAVLAGSVLFIAAPLLTAQFGMSLPLAATGLVATLLALALVRIPRPAQRPSRRTEPTPAGSRGLAATACDADHPAPDR